MAVGHGFMTSRNLCVILHLYLSFSSLFGPNHHPCHLFSSGNVLLYVSDEIVASKPIFDPKSIHQGSRDCIAGCTKFLISCRILQNVSISWFLIALSNDVSVNPGPELCSPLHHPSPKARGLSICHLNVRSLLHKMDSLRLLMLDKPYHVITLSETWLNSSILDFELDLPGYSIIRNDRSRRSGGGTAIYVRDDLPYFIWPDLMENGLETCWIEIQRPKAKKLFVCSIYRAPDFPLSTLIDELNSFVNGLPLNMELVLLGDFNVNFAHHSGDASARTLKRHLSKFSNLHNLDQLISGPTRVTPVSSSTIDLIFVNNNHHIVESGVVPVSLSDHSLVYCVMKSGVPKACPRVIEYRSYKHYNKSDFLKELSDQDWSFVYTDCDLDQVVDRWCNLFTGIADTHAPIKSLRVKGNKAPWLTPNLSQSMRDRDYHHRKAIKSQSTHHWSMYNKLKSYVNKEVKKAKITFYQDLIATNKGDSSGLWKVLNNIISNDKKEKGPSCIISEEMRYNNPQSIAEIFNKFFSNIGLHLVNKLKSSLHPSNTQLNIIPTSCFTFKELDESFVTSQLCSLKTKKAIGLDRISARLLKDSAVVISPYLTYIFNKSLSTATVHSLLFGKR